MRRSTAVLQQNIQRSQSANDSHCFVRYDCSNQLQQSNQSRTPTSTVTQQLLACWCRISYPKSWFCQRTYLECATRRRPSSHSKRTKERSALYSLVTAAPLASRSPRFVTCSNAKLHSGELGRAQHWHLAARTAAKLASRRTHNEDHVRFSELWADLRCCFFNNPRHSYEFGPLVQSCTHYKIRFLAGGLHVTTYGMACLIGRHTHTDFHAPCGHLCRVKVVRLHE